MAHPIDRAFWEVLGRRSAARVIRRYGVAAFLRRVKWHHVTGGQKTIIRICEMETPEVGNVMAEVFATGMY